MARSEVLEPVSRESSFENRGAQMDNLRRYYKLHALIYDATRWSFLFGRGEVLAKLPPAEELPAAQESDAAPEILEIGCGTGKNLASLARRYPQARLTGVDLSEDMIRQASRKLQFAADRLRLVEEPYEAGSQAANRQYDLILFSYSLTMMNPQWREILEQARQDLKPGGVLAAADFHDTRFAWFRRHMQGNHVRVEGHVLPWLRENLTPLYDRVGSAYGGVWEYYVFIGRKAD